MIEERMEQDELDQRWPVHVMRDGKPVLQSEAEPYDIYRARKLAEAQGENEMAKKAKSPKAKSEGRKPTLAPFVSSSFTIYGSHAGKEVQATVLASGVVRSGGKDYTSPSAAAKAIVGAEVNGFVFWKYNRDGERVLLNSIRGSKAIKVKAASAKPRSKAKAASAKPRSKAKAAKKAMKAKARKPRALRPAPATSEVPAQSTAAVEEPTPF